jgi:hypothetical protein
MRVMMRVVMMKSETWFRRLGEEHRLRVFENRLMRIYRTKGKI